MAAKDGVFGYGLHGHERFFPRQRRHCPQALGLQTLGVILYPSSRTLLRPVTLNERQGFICSIYALTHQEREFEGY